MTTPRDDLRSARNLRFRKARAMGIDLTAERQKPGSNARSLALAATRMINNAVPRTDREDLQTDAPPAGAFNSSNKLFTLSGPVQGVNIAVGWFHVADVTFHVLRRTNNNPPLADEFLFDINAPTIITMGDAPDAADMVMAVYKTLR